MKHEHKDRDRFERERKPSAEPAARKMEDKREGNASPEEEFAAELAVPGTGVMPAREERDRPQDGTRMEERAGEQLEAMRWLGYTALIMAILSLFVLPILFGPAAAVLGAFAFMFDQRAFGVWSVAIGLLALVGYLLLVPLYA